MWDSSIVLAKFIEGQGSKRFAGKRCVDLSAGCGLPGVVLARLGAAVTATDLAPNLPLLEKNSAANGERSGKYRAALPRTGCVSFHPPPATAAHTTPLCASAAAGCDITVREHSWGGDVAHLEPPFDFVFACDVMYIHELVQPLVASLVALSGPSTDIYIAHGRNRQVGGAAGSGGRRWAAGDGRQGGLVCRSSAFAALAGATSCPFSLKTPPHPPLLFSC